MRLKDTFIQKAPAKEVETATRRQIRAAMHEAAGYEAIFDLIAQHGMHKCPDCNADVEDNESGSTLCKDCRAKPVAKKESQAGGPNMLAPLDAPEALDIDVNDMSDKWPEQDILKQVQDLRTQGMQDGSIFKQLMEMQVLGTPTPLPEDMTYLKSIMKSAQVKDPKRQKELDQIEQFKNKKKVDKPKPPEDDAPADSSAPKPSELNTFDQNVFKQTGPDGKPLMERPKGPKLQLDTIEEMQAVAESFIAMLRKVKDKVKIVIEELLKADHPLPGGVSSDVLEEGQTPAGTPTKSDKSSLRRELAFLQNKLERADGAYMRLIRHPGMDEMLQGIELEFLHKAIAMPLTGDDLGVWYAADSEEADIEIKELAKLKRDEKKQEEAEARGALPKEELMALVTKLRSEGLDDAAIAAKLTEMKAFGAPKAPLSEKEKAINKEERDRKKKVLEQKIKYKKVWHPNFVPPPQKAPKKPKLEEPGGEMERTLDPSKKPSVSTAPLPGPTPLEKDRLREVEERVDMNPGKKYEKIWARIEAQRGQSPEQLKEMLQDHGKNDAFKAKPPSGPPKPAPKMVQPQNFDPDQIQNAPIDVDPLTPQQEIDDDLDFLMPGHAAQAKPPAPPPAAPAGGPPAPKGPPGAPPGGQPPIGPPSMDDDMGDDMEVEDMRTLVEVMSDLEDDFAALKEKVESGDAMLHGEEVEPVEDDTGALPGGPPKVAVDDSAKDYYSKYYKEYGKQLTDDRVASVIDLIDEVGSTYREILDGATAMRVAKYVASRPRHSVELTDEKLTRVSDKIFVNYLFKTGMIAENLGVTAAAVFKNAIWNSGEAYRIAKYAESKMKTPKPKGQPDDAVKVDKMKDNADDAENRVRPAHLKMEVVNEEHDKTYQYLDIEWDADDEAAKRTDAGMSQAVISYVKGLESTKEFKDLGFLGQITIDEIDIDGGTATVHFRTQKMHGPLRTVNHKE